MPLDPELLKILACPSCKSSLEYRKDPERLICHGCRKHYPIQEGIPVLLVEEARPL